MSLISRRSPEADLDADSLEDQVSLSSAATVKKGRASRTLFTECANLECKSGLLHLLRSRSVPVFEKGWNCSEECTEARVIKAVQRELRVEFDPPSEYPFRIPLGTLMLQKKWVTAEQLEKALENQRAEGAGKIGHYLVEEGVTEHHVARALGMQRDCPVLTVHEHDLESMTALVPRVFIETFGALPVRLAGRKILYLGYEDKLDPILAECLGRMLELRVENGIVPDSVFQPTRERVLARPFPSAEVVEAATGAAVVDALTNAIERVKPFESRLVRVRDFLWLRMWLKQQTGHVPDIADVQDVICRIPAA